MFKRNEFGKSAASTLGVLLGFLLSAVVGPSVSKASDGVVEINHTCAIQTGCFPGDSVGYPVTITGAAGRSFLLTSDLVLPDSNTSGIEISVANVSIDLNGFSIMGQSCFDSIAICTPLSGNGVGILVQDASAHGGTSVKNGSITGMGSFGILLGWQGRVQHVTARWNRTGGILVATGIVSECTARENGSAGIQTGIGSSVSNNTSDDNGTHGIAVGEGSRVSGNSTSDNGNHGISVGPASVVTGNSSANNEFSGITADERSTIQGNTCQGNSLHGIICSNPDGGCLVQDNNCSLNAIHGIFVTSKSVVRRNSLTNNSGSGVFANGADNRIESNNAISNYRAYEITGAGNIIVKNSASGSTGGNYNIASGNTHGPLLSAEGVGSLTNLTGGDHPWANFGF